MTQPAERRFVMEPRLDAEVETINDALATKVDTTDARLSDQRVPTDNSVTSAKIANGAIVDADVNASAAIAASKIAGTAVTQADTQSVTSTMIVNKTIVAGDIADNTIVSENLAEQDYIKFDTTYAGGSTQAGMLAWDQDNETLEFMLDDHVTLQIGQEHVMRVKNNSGSVAIPERTVVMFAGAAGDTIKVSPAVSDGSVNVNYLAGITTEEIPADGFGFITQLGFINQVNTNAWTVGTLLYVDPATPGGLTATEPASPAWTMPVAAVTKQNASAGRILVRSIPGGSGAGGGASVVVAESAPVSGNEGDLWLDSTDGTLYVYYEDVDGSQWIQVQANSALGASIESRLGALESQAIAMGAMSPNYVINGGMDIAQRGTGTSTSSGNFAADRFYFEYSTGTMTTQRVTDGPDGVSPYSLKVTATSAGTRLATDYFNIVHNLEGAQVSGLGFGFAGAKSVTISFYVKASLTGTYSGTLFSGANTRGYGFTYTINSANTWERKSVTIVGDVTGGTSQYPIDTSTGLRLRLGLGNGANYNISSAGSWLTETNKTSVAGAAGWAQTVGATFQITGVQVEQGSTATSFRRNAQSIQGELAACQRYYYRMNTTTGAPMFAVGTAGGGSDVYAAIPFKQNMRVKPTSIDYSALSQFSLYSATQGALNGLTALTLDGWSSSDTGALVASKTSSLAGDRPYIIYANTASAYIGFSAEL